MRKGQGSPTQRDICVDNLAILVYNNKYITKGKYAMRKKQTYHITLPDNIIREIEELKKLHPIINTRSGIIALAVHELYTDTVVKKVK